MGAVAVGALLAAVLIAIVALMVWQAARRSEADDPAEYLVPEAARFVYERLSDRALESLDLDDVNLLLEWQVYYHQVVAPRERKERPIVGSGDSIEYLMERSAESGRSFDVLEIAEVIAADTEYLVAIGAIGEAVEQ